MARDIYMAAELGLEDPKAGAAQLCAQLGFSERGDTAGRIRLTLGNQDILVGRASASADDSAFNHLALSVPDVDRALQDACERGARLDRAFTPDGPMEIAEFWDTGVRYVFVEGPEGAHVEFCARRGPARAGGPGHDHVGICCRDIAAMNAFFAGLGFSERAAVTLHRPEGRTDVVFLGAGAYTLELYSPPERRAASDTASVRGKWQGLLIANGADEPGPRIGPEGMHVTLLSR